MSADIEVRRATAPDAIGISELVGSYAERNLMLPRPPAAVYAHLRDFLVATDAQGVLLGCCALSVLDADLAEVRSLAVADGCQGRGIGRMLVEASLADARTLLVPRVFALTRVPEFFENLGFARTEMRGLPQKVWNDCIHCPLFPDCDEIALIRAS